MRATVLCASPAPGFPRPTPSVQLLLPTGSVDETQRCLRSSSAAEREALVLWAGRATGPHSATVTHLLAPECTASRDVLVVPQDERVAVAAYLRANELLVFADLHTHPGRAFLSLADRARPFSARPGFYAIVLPDFAIHGPLEGWRIYQAVPGDWEEVDVAQCIRQEGI